MIDKIDLPKANEANKEARMAVKWKIKIIFGILPRPTGI